MFTNECNTDTYKLLIPKAFFVDLFFVQKYFKPFPNKFQRKDFPLNLNNV